MKFYKAVGKYEFLEQQVQHLATGKIFTLTDRVKVFNEDYYTVSRYTADIDSRTVFEFAIMNNNGELERFFVDSNTAEQIIAEHLHEFLNGNMNRIKLIEQFEQLKADYMQGR